MISDALTAKIIALLGKLSGKSRNFFRREAGNQRVGGQKFATANPCLGGSDGGCRPPTTRPLQMSLRASGVPGNSDLAKRERYFIAATSTCNRRARASLTICSNCRAVASSIHSSPHCEQIVASTSRTTTTPLPRSTLKVVLPFVFLPPQIGQISLGLLITFSLFDSPTRKRPMMVRKR
jgi:hypothetical protein